MATQQEVLEIVTDFMLNAPPGEFLDVVHDIRGLLADESILNSTALPTFREYNTDHMIQISLPIPDSAEGAQYQVLITKEAEVADNEFIDHRGNQVLIFDHFRQQVVGQRPIRPEEINADGEPTRAALEFALDEYVVQHYPNGTGAVYCGRQAAPGSGQDTYVLCISSGAFQPHNYWNGRWRSRWEFVYPSTNGAVQLNGSVRLHVHYYENGNVQMRGDCPLQATAVVPAEAQTWEEITAPIVKAIEKAEAEFQKNLNNGYETMGDTTFKALRRILPITRSKIDWEKLQNYRMGADISEYTMD